MFRIIFQKKLIFEKKIRKKKKIGREKYPIALVNNYSKSGKGNLSRFYETKDFIIIISFELKFC